MSEHAFKGRREDDRLVTGQGRYTSDWNLPGQLYGCFMRSDRAHADIVSLDVSGARKAPGVVAVFTGEDTIRAGFKTQPMGVNIPGKDGTAVKIPRRDVLANGRVRMVGQEIAFVVATSVAAAQDAVELIEIEYRDLPAVVEVEEALAPGAPQLHDDIPGNVCFEFEYGDKAKTDEAFARAAHVTRVQIEANRVAPAPMEPKGCLASYDEDTDRYDLYFPHQGASMMTDGLCLMVNLPAEKLRVHPIDVGGGFGPRAHPYTEYLSVMLATKTLGKPVKWVGSRAESFLSDYQGRAVQLAGELALDAQNRIIGMRTHWTINAGAYLTPSSPLTNTMNPSTHVVNTYRIPAVHGLHRFISTNTTPTTAYRGAARPSVIYLAERLIEETAREVGMDRVEFRRLNMIPRDAFPYKTPTTTYDSGDPIGEMDEALAIVDWKGFAARRAESARRGKLRGIGLGAFVEPSGAALPKEEVALRFEPSGKAILYTNSGSTGQGHETVFPDMAARVLGIPAENIELRASSLEAPPLAGSGSFGSRSMAAHGGAADVAAKEVVRKGYELASETLEVAASELTFEHGTYRVPGTDVAVSLQRLIEKHAGRGPHPLDSLGSVACARVFSGGVHICEVEIDQESGELQILRYVAVDDAGFVVNHALVEGQIAGGIVQGIGQVIGEWVQFDPENAQMLTGTFMDYAMPRADNIPEMELHDHSVPSPLSPFGIKGVGEAGATGAVATVANAVMDALRPLGINHLDLPYSPRRLWEAIRKARPAQAA